MKHHRLCACARCHAAEVHRTGAHGPSQRRGTHALRRRCPVCRKLRRFYEPPGDQGGERPGREAKGWAVVAGVWTCPWCVAGAGAEGHRRDP